MKTGLSMHYLTFSAWLWREIQSPEGGGQAELKACGLEAEGATTPGSESLPGHHCWALGLVNPTLLAPSMGPKAAHTGAETCHPSGKCWPYPFFPENWGWACPPKAQPRGMVVERWLPPRSMYLSPARQGLGWDRRRVSGAHLPPWPSE